MYIRRPAQQTMCGYCLYIFKLKCTGISLSVFAGVHSAIQHDSIMSGGSSDYVVVETEAKKVAQSAARALRESRRRCLAGGGGWGQLTWTGQYGSAGGRSQQPRCVYMRVCACVCSTLLRCSSSPALVYMYMYVCMTLYSVVYRVLNKPCCSIHTFVVYLCVCVCRTIGKEMYTFQR